MRTVPTGSEAIALILGAAYLAPVSMAWKSALFLLALACGIVLRIDSRFFILGGILHLWFSLFAGSSLALAEASAVFAVHYLLIGVIGLLIERFRHAPPDLQYLLDSLLVAHRWAYPAIAGVLGFAAAYALDLGETKMMMFAYVATLPLVVLAAQWLLEMSEEHA